MEARTEHSLDLAVASYRDTVHHLVVSSGLRWHSILQHFSAMGHWTSWHVQTSSIHWPPAASKPLSIGPLGDDVCWPLALMKVGDAPMGKLQGVLEIRRKISP